MLGVVRVDPPLDAASRFAEFTTATLRRAIRELDTEFPAGTTGVIVHAYEDGVGYEVEFSDPAEMVLTLTANDLR